MVINNLETIRITLRGAFVEIWNGMMKIAFFEVLRTDWINI